MSNRTAVLVSIGIVATIFVLVLIAEYVRPAPRERATSSLSTPAPEPILPVPSPPDTALPTVSTEPPSTTVQPRPTTTTTTPEPEPEPEAEVKGEQAVAVAGDDIDAWLAIGRCEQPGNEWGGVRWSHPGPTYQGGLGFWYGTWDQYKQGTSAAGIDNAGDATPMQQIEVARNVRAAHGYRAWGCAKKLGFA